MSFDPGLRKVASAFYCFLNTPRSLTCEIMLRYNEFHQLATMAIDPKHYLEGSVGAEKYRRDAQATDLLRKSPLLPLGVDRRQAAIDSFWECEKQCLVTNQFLQLLHYPSSHESAMEGRLREILLKARKIAGRILGKLPEDLEGAFGPGTSFEMKGQTYSTVADKLWITPHATPASMQLFEHTYWPTLWGRTRLELGLPLPATCRGNRFATVPKDALKDRGICVEPLGNLWLQLGVGRYLKRRLSRVGILVGKTSQPSCPIQRLKTRPSIDGQTLHRMLARDGSADGSWATIDLSNASDTVATELVRWVIPADWFELLYALRSPFTLIGGQWVRLDKFSSMGNGYTFELETLIFSSILAACCELKVGLDLFVYGDDILIPVNKGPDAMAILRACGFTPNMKKSFLSGPFRESCGGDFFSGWNVRPYQADGRFQSPLEWVAFHNHVKRRFPTAKLVLTRIVERLPTRLRLFGPEWLGDRVLHGPPTRTWVSNGIRWLATIEVQPLRVPLKRWGDEFIFTLATLGCTSNGISPRGEIAGYRISKASIS